MIEFSLANGGGLIVFSPEDVTGLIVSMFDQFDAVNSNSSTLLLSLARSLTRIYSNSCRSDISLHIGILQTHLTNCLLPAVELPDMETFAPELLQDPIISPFRQVTAANPELLFEYFNFIAQCMSRYSSTWVHNDVQRWMLSSLISLSIPEGGMSFQGATDILVFPYLLGT